MRGRREEHLQGHRKALPVHQVRRGKVHSAGGRRGPRPLKHISLSVTPVKAKQIREKHDCRSRTNKCGYLGCSMYLRGLLWRILRSRSSIGLSLWRGRRGSVIALL